MRQQSRPAVAERWYRPVMVGLAVLLLLAGLVVGCVYLGVAMRDDAWGRDYQLFGEIGRRFIEDGSGYAPYQLERPYSFDENIATGDVRLMPDLYPPYAGPIFAVTRFIPAVLWWVIPLTIIGWFVVTSRPAPWTWPLMALAAVSPNTWGILVAGGSSMWIAAFVALGFRYGWPAGLVAFKPTFLPLALIGWRNRWTWLVLFSFAVMAYFLTAELGNYVLALQNVRGVTIGYSVADLPFVLVPVIAYLGSTHAAFWSVQSARRRLAGLEHRLSAP